jgi:hypothetical protein
MLLCARKVWIKCNPSLCFVQEEENLMGKLEALDVGDMHVDTWDF